MQQLVLSFNVQAYKLARAKGVSPALAIQFARLAKRFPVCESPEKF